MFISPCGSFPPIYKINGPNGAKLNITNINIEKKLKKKIQSHKYCTLESFSSSSHDFYTQ